MRPASGLVYSFLGFTALALFAGLARVFFPQFVTAFSLILSCLLVLFFLILVYDWFHRPSKKNMMLQRILPANLAIGTGNKVELVIENLGKRALTLTVTDHFPSQLTVEGLPFSITLQPFTIQRCIYSVYPEKRGNACFSFVDILVESPLRLWSFRWLFDLPMNVKIFPNFTAIKNFEMLIHDRMVTQMGIHVLQRRGEGLDFHQLREFRAGDALRQVDWKATARQRKPISREYQDERDQDVIFLLDSGRRMHARDGLLSHFDHSLNAMLLTAYVALCQGDAIGFVNFANSDIRHFSPVKGKTKLNVLLQQVYDLHSSAETSDYLEAATSLISFHRKRSLVILVTNLRMEDFDDLLDAIELLSRQHLVMVASLKEVLLEQGVKQKVTDFDQALSYSSLVNYIQQRKRLLFRLKKKGVIIVDALPSEMHVALVNEYLALKRSGRL